MGKDHLGTCTLSSSHILSILFRVLGPFPSALLPIGLTRCAQRWVLGLEAKELQLLDPTHTARSVDTRKIVLDFSVDTLPFQVVFIPRPQ
jgi:hypothetical protein